MKINKITIEYTVDPTKTCVFTVVTDASAGRRGRYTVHCTSLVGHKGTQILGREVTLRHARSLVYNYGSNRAVGQ